eukprot:EG_transcript_2424
MVKLKKKKELLEEDKRNDIANDTSEPRMGTQPMIDPRFSLKKLARSEPKTDSRGRPLHKSSDAKLQELYSMEADSSGGRKRPKDVKAKEDSESEEEEAEDENDDEEDEEEDEEDEEGEDEDEEGESESGSSDKEYNAEVEAELAKEEDLWQGGEVRLREDATYRLSVVNCDWDHLSAQDIFHHMKDALPPTGSIKSVTVYPSEYGKKAMEEERVNGPNIWKEEGEAESEEGEGEDDDSNGELEPYQRLSAAERELDFEEEHYSPDENSSDGDGGKDGGAIVSDTKFRAYEMRRLRYFYAIVTFDSAATANHVYEQLDGVEILSSGVAFDLRFVPDDMQFNDAEARDTCTKIGPEYTPLKPFVSNALQNSCFRVSWDQELPTRKQAVARCFDEDVIRGRKEIDLSNVLASSESDTEDEAPSKEEKVKKVRARYEKLLDDIRQELPEGFEMDDESEEGEADGKDAQGSSESESEQQEDSEEGEEEEEDNTEGEGEGEAEPSKASARRKKGPDLPEDGAEIVAEFHNVADPRTVRDRLLKAKEAEGLTLFEKRQAKLKTERKQRKKAKRLQYQEEAAQLDAEREARKEEEAAELQQLMQASSMKVLEASDKAPKLNRRDHRKQHAQKKKAEAAAQREQKKQQRLALYEAAQRGEDLQKFQAEMAQQKVKQKAEAVAGKLDNRFSRLLSDADFTIESSHPRFKKADELRQIQQLQHVGQQKRRRPPTARDPAAAEGEGEGDEGPAPKKVALADYVAKFNALASSKLQKKLQGGPRG